MNLYNLYLEDIRTYIRQGKLAEYEDQLLSLAREYLYFENATVYSAKILELHLKLIEEVPNLDDVSSAIMRCVEHGFTAQLQLLLENLPRLVSMCERKAPLDKRLLLRKCNVNCYLIAKQHGFIDNELEKRIIFLQRKFRRQTPNSLVYQGPTPKEYSLDENYGVYPRYWGYRQTLYFIRWNRYQRLVILRLIKSDYGDCNATAYIDYLEKGNENALNFLSK